MPLASVAHNKTQSLIHELPLGLLQIVRPPWAAFRGGRGWGYHALERTRGSRRGALCAGRYRTVSSGRASCLTGRCADWQRSHRILARMPLEHLDALLSQEGWPYASTPPVEPGRPRPLPRAVRARLADLPRCRCMPARPTWRAPRCARSPRARAAPRTRRSRRSRARSATSSAPRRRRAVPRPAATGPARGDFSYYGTSDATSWFLVVLGASATPRWRPSSSGPGARPRAGWSARSSGRRLLSARAEHLRAAGSCRPAGATRSTATDGGGFVRADGTPRRPAGSPTPTRRR